eukprot:gene4166-4415_t
MLALNSTVLEQSGQWFELSWSGVSHPSYADWIALLVPAGADFTQTAPAKYKIAALDKQHVSTGTGRLTFRLINYRHPMQFAFMRNGLMQPVLAALSPVIEVKNPNEPLQRHLALTGGNTQMLVQWVTRDSKQPVVKWGQAPGSYSKTTPATSSDSYTRQEMCGPPATTIGFINPGLFHSGGIFASPVAWSSSQHIFVADIVFVALQHLCVSATLGWSTTASIMAPDGEKYLRQISASATAELRWPQWPDWGFSEEASFLAAPPVGPATSVKILAVADLGQAELDGSMEQSEMVPSLNTTAGLLQDVIGAGYQLLMHNGDISYARGYVTQWDNFMQQMEPIISQVPYMTAIGNHERDWPNSGDRYTEVYDS